MVVTVQDFCLEMGIDPSHMIGMPVEGDTSCGSMTCAQINRMVSDIAWAESVIDGMLKKYGKSLYYKQTKLAGDAPYFWVKEPVIPGKLVTVNKTATVVVDEDGLVATVTIELSDSDFDPDCDKVVQVIFKETCGQDCPKKLQPKWAVLVEPVAVEGGFELVLETDAYAITECACDGSGCAALDEISVDVVILKPSPPRMGTYSNGCDGIETTCANCGGYSTVEGCIVRKSGSTFNVSFDNTCCGCSGGGSKIYELDVVVPPEDIDSAMVNAIISLSNTRKALFKCEQCSTESQERIRFDLGILDEGTGGTDQRVAQAFMFTNPFGILMPGALSAWRVISDRVAGIGGAGHF